MGTAYRSCKLSNSGSPHDRVTAPQMRRENIDSWTSTPPGHQLAHRIQTLL